MKVNNELIDAALQLELIIFSDLNKKLNYSLKKFYTSLFLF